MVFTPHHDNGAAFQGNIAAIPLDNIFQFLDFASLTGELQIVAPHNSGSFFFHEGVLVFSSLTNNPKKIGELLRESELVTEEQFNECLAIHLMQKKCCRIGEILTRKGYVQEPHLAGLIQTQAKNAFFETLSWSEGTFYFYNDTSPHRNTILMRERIDHLLLEGVVRLDNAKNKSGNQPKL